MRINRQISKNFITRNFHLKCFVVCLTRTAFVTNTSPHSWHICFFSLSPPSPWTVLMWCVTWDFCVKAFPHSSHLWGFSPVWIRIYFPIERLKHKLSYNKYNYVAFHIISVHGRQAFSEREILHHNPEQDNEKDLFLHGRPSELINLSWCWMWLDNVCMGGLLWVQSQVLNMC